MSEEGANKLLGKRSANFRNRNLLEKRLRLETVRARLDGLDNLSDSADSSSSSDTPPLSPSPSESSKESDAHSLHRSGDESEVHSTVENWEVISRDDPSDHDQAEFEEVDGHPAPPVDNLTYLKDFLSKWAQRGVSFKKVDELLVGLNVLYPELTKCHTVLLKSPKLGEDFIHIGDGLFWYKGFAANLRQRLTAEYLLRQDRIVTDINIDGLELFKSSKLCFWPILGCLEGQRTPFIIACYCGEGHPEDLDIFFQHFIEEALDLQQNGFEFASTKFPFELKNFILDAPARALIKCCVGHTGKAACEKCSIVGIRKYNRIVFVGVEEAGELRTDDSFGRRDQPEHHKGTSPLERDLGIPMVSAFRLDGMHLVHSGVFKRWVLYLLGDLHRKQTAEEIHIREMNRAAGVPQPKYRPRGKITAAAKNAINVSIFEIAPSIPCDFSRRPRSLHYVHYFKCTEWRRILLYDGIRIFKNNIPPNAYKIFLLLHCGIYILSSPQLVKDERMLRAAELILNEFVTSSVEVFDESFVVYNVHSLTHLVDECRLHGEIDSFSAFKYESYLGSIKRILRSTHQPLHQLRNRDRECDGWLLQKDRSGRSLDEVTLKSRRAEDKKLEERFDGDQIRKILVLGFTLTSSVADCAFKTVDGEIGILSNVIHCADGQILLSGYKFQDLGDYYTYPLNSSELGILKVKNLLPEKIYWRVSKIAQKCVLLPERDGDSYLCIPLLDYTHVDA